MGVKRKKGTYLGAEEIRRILTNSEIQSKSESIPITSEEISIESLEKIIKKPFKIISDEIYSRVQNLKNLTEDDKELLLKDLATLNEKQIEEWLNDLENMEE